ncbi:hypothetical protein [Aliivibrio kagoshimensis]|uniref:hypothetical protein n=1 Tax=Aliivibrio kagoshimensis TaxID=2910230 RepID=UPI003D0AEA67
MTEVNLKAQPIPNRNDDIRSDPFVQKLLSRMPDEVSNSFTEKQLTCLLTSLGSRRWGRHKVDVRTTVGFFHWRYYFVFLFGRNRRELSRLEERVSLLAKAVMLTTALLFVLLVVYLLKSAAGIDLFPGFSLGIWGWFKGEYL